MAETPQASQPVVGLSLESIFLLHHVDALQRLENIITMSELSEEARSSMLAMQSAYLLHLLPDREKQNEILQATQAYEKQLKAIDKNLSDSLLLVHCTFYIVTSIIQYLNSALDLIHEDIIGAVGDHVITKAKEKMKELEGTAPSAPQVQGGDGNGTVVSAIS
jgi:hypothetical protein